MLSKKLKWYPLFESVEKLEELFVGKSVVVHRSMFGEALLLKDGGDYYAFKNKCPHQKKPLNDCKVIEGHVVCPFHRYRFSLENGRGHGLYLDQYQIKIENNQVFIGMEKWSFF